MMKFSKRDSKKMIKEMARLYGLSVSEVREQIQDKIIAVMEVTTQTSRQSLSVCLATVPLPQRNLYVLPANS